MAFDLADASKPLAQPQNKQNAPWRLFGMKAKQPAEQDVVEEVISFDADFPPKSQVSRGRDLVFMHIPSNFGHTVEKVALMKPEASTQDMLDFVSSKSNSSGKTAKPLAWTDVMEVARPDAEVWGRMSPHLQLVSNTTGCNLYHTPPQYWPKSVAKRYFRSNKTVFGILRDPYERIVSYFRANPKGHWDDRGKLRCDVNAGVKQMMQKYISSDNKFMDNCAFLPQAEFFQDSHGITLPVDSRKFPHSLNEVFKQHGYEALQVQEKDIPSIPGCTEVWAGDLEKDTKQLIRKVYAKDFELICKHFGHCKEHEDTCIEGAPSMCPRRVMAELQMMRFWGGKNA